MKLGYYFGQITFQMKVMKGGGMAYRHYTAYAHLHLRGGRVFKKWAVVGSVRKVLI